MRGAKAGLDEKTEFRLRKNCIDGPLGGQVQVMMSYETCVCYFLSSATLDRSGHDFLHGDTPTC